MAKPITATPPVKGEAAKIIQREIMHGTPNTPERQAAIHRADSVFQKASAQAHVKPQS